LLHLLLAAGRAAGEAHVVCPLLLLLLMAA
jgi:hypothetical protein